MIANRANETLGAGLHVAQTVAAVATRGGVKAAAVVLHEQADFAIALVDAYSDPRRSAVTQSVAGGLAHDLQRLDTLVGREPGGRLFIDVDVELRVPACAQFGQQAPDRAGEVGASEVGGGQPTDIGSHVTDGIVEAGADLLEPPVGVFRIRFNDRPHRFQREADRVKRLDDAVVQVAPEANLLFERLGQKVLLERCILLGEPPDVAFPVERRALCHRRLRQAGQGADFGTGDREGRGRVVGARRPAGHDDDQRQDQGRTGQPQGEALRMDDCAPRAGLRRSAALGHPTHLGRFPLGTPPD